MDNITLYLLTDRDLTVQQMATILEVSIRTVKRRLHSWNLSIRQQYAVITNDSLDAKILELLSFNPNLGEKLFFSFRLKYTLKYYRSGPSKRY